MAKCEQGYLCEVCGAEVEGITESDLYLRYVLGEVDPGWLPVSPERHLRCNPALAQYIVDASFEKVSAFRGKHDTAVAREAGINVGARKHQSERAPFDVRCHSTEPLAKERREGAGVRFARLFDSCRDRVRP